MFYLFICSSLTPEQRAVENGIVMFILKDQDFMGMTDEFISESFVHFKDIPSTKLENDLGNIPQIKLTLTTPKSLGIIHYKFYRYVIYELFFIVQQTRKQ